MTEHDNTHCVVHLESETDGVCEHCLLPDWWVDGGCDKCGFIPFDETTVTA